MAAADQLAWFDYVTKTEGLDFNPAVVTCFQKDADGKWV